MHNTHRGYDYSGVPYTKSRGRSHNTHSYGISLGDIGGMLGGMAQNLGGALLGQGAALLGDAIGVPVAPVAAAAPQRPSLVKPRPVAPKPSPPTPPPPPPEPVILGDVHGPKAGDDFGGISKPVLLLGAALIFLMLSKKR